MQPLALEVTTVLVAGGWTDWLAGRLLSLSVFCCWPSLKEDTLLGYTDLKCDTYHPFKLSHIAMSHLLQRAVLNFQVSGQVPVNLCAVKHHSPRPEWVPPPSDASKGLLYPNVDTKQGTGSEL